LTATSKDRESDGERNLTERMLGQNKRVPPEGGVGWEWSLFMSGERERSEILPHASRVAVEGRASKPKSLHLVLSFISDRPPSFLAFPSKSSLPVKEISFAHFVKLEMRVSQR
jgi:hypothetical protein